MPRLRLCLLWHMLQRMYRDPESGEYILPWVRLHATRAYYDMARVLGEYEGARAVVNMVPSLLWQLDDYVQGRAKDRFLDLTRKPAAELSPNEREFVLRNFFMVDWETNVRTMSRYWELLHKRGRDVRAVDLSRLSFSTSELRDLQVLFNLQWMGFRATEEEEVVRALRAKGREFTEDDKAALLETQQRIMSKVMPALAEVARSGQVELTVTPFYHPILPLVIDTDSARRAMPHAQLPPRFTWPEDAQVHVRRALDFAEQHLGTRPKGMWPAEGSVSPEALALLAREGVQWAATDEGNLLRSSPHRERNGSTLYRPYRAAAGDREIAMIFRDRGLSDLIGFSYAKSPPNDAVDDLFKHLDTIANAAEPGEVPFVTIALDGENAWEHYPHSGRDFLRTLYRRLGAHEGGIEPVTPTAFFAQHPPRERIDEIHTGSWIDSNFRIWIGHPEDNQGWTYLRDARRAVADREELVARGRADLAPKVAQAKEALYVAEGSDWFWWYGDDFTSDCIAEFDALFRSYVKAAWRALGEPVPAQLDAPIKQLGMQVASPQQEPQGFIRPRLDGRIKSYFDWAGAGLYAPSEAQGAMFRGEGIFGALCFGFDEKTLYLRLDPTSAPTETARKASELRVLLANGDRRIEVAIATQTGEPAPSLIVGEDAPERPVGRASFHDILELGLPFEQLGLTSGTRVALAVQVMRQGVEVERLPRHGYLSFTVPDEDYERKNWKA
ncbi:MAG: glycoside hydrolase [Deltaproteobacteria bacterium]|nr:glycoside hydrolase [Deltaproteobacteria bacterium]